jgi:FkbM family methyltransferase
MSSIFADGAGLDMSPRNPADQRKVFIDCGSNLGKALEGRILSGSENEFFAFEPQPELLDCLDDVQRRHPDVPIHFFNKAVWIHNGTTSFYLATKWGPNYKGGSTLLRGHRKNKSEVDYTRAARVECLDFSRWLRENFTPVDHIVVKMDIEGAEYAVLEKMVADGAIDYVNELLVEFHWRMNDSISQERHNALIQALKGRVLVKEWH